MTTKRALGPAAGSRRSQLLWGASDQAFSSLGNFLVGLVIVRTSALAEFGAFSIALAVYMTTVAALRAFGSKTFAIRYSTAVDERRRPAERSLLGLAVVLGLLVSLVCLGVRPLFESQMQGMLLVVGVILPGLLVQDAVRFVFVATGRARAAAGNDAFWLVLQVLCFGVIAGLHDQSAPVLFAAWGVSGVVAGIVGLVQARILPSLRGAIRFSQDHHRIALPLVGEQVASQGANQFTVFVLALVLPLSSLGALRAGQLMVSPLNVLQQATPLVGLPEARIRAEQSVGRLRFAVLVMGGVLVGATVLLVVVVLLLPDSVGVVIFGNGWEAGRTVVIPLGVRNLFGGVTLACFVGLHSIEHVRVTLKVGIVRGVASLGFGLVGGLIWATQGAAWGLALADLVAAAATFVAFRSIMAKLEAKGGAPVAASSEPSVHGLESL